jgi:hypothetical protein
MKLNIVILLLLSLFFNSCKNDLKLNAPYKEYPSIYAVLNPQDKVQMIRINKVFLGEGDANTMAQIADSVNYPAGELEVTLERYVNGIRASAIPNGIQDKIIFSESVVTTSAGAFARSQRVYVTSDRLCVTGEYVLKVTNTRTKNIFTARTQAIDSVKSSGFPPFSPKFYPVDPQEPITSDNYINYGKPQNTYSLRFPKNEAIIYQLTMRLHYLDSMDTGNNYAFVDYAFGRQHVRDAAMFANQGPFLSNTFKGSDLYASVGISMGRNSIPVSNIRGRRMYKLGFIIYSSTQDYLDYLEFSAPSLSIAQEKPLYSNFENRAAIGIFAFRARYAIEKEMDSEFITQFAINPNTCRYKFYQMPGFYLPPCL